MRVSLEWLNEYVNIEGLEPEAIAEALTNSGLEVESIEATGVQFSGVIVAKVEEVSPHPNADRLRLVRVNLGAAGESRVVCGAPNVAPGMRVAYAQIGARLVDRKAGGLFELQPAVIRGVESRGMICSVEELGLQEQYPAQAAGIWSLDAYVTDADLGRNLKEVLRLQSDVILDVTPNANRGDLMSMIGISREVSALFNRSASFPCPEELRPALSGPFEVELPDPSVCHFYAGAVLNDVAIGSSPDWMVRRLLNSGIRSINNVVDITNYVMLEYGQPLHAFDAAKLGEGGVIRVRHAGSGESFRTLDGITRSLTEQSVVVTLDDRPIGLGGVMGGEDTEISEGTQRIVLESAYFPPASNRRSARSVGLRSESSARFERGVDPLACEAALNRAIGLLQQYAGATVHSVAKADRRQLEPIEVPLSFPRMKRVLGLSIEPEKARNTLLHLGFQLKEGASPDALIAVVPSFRRLDVTREIDLIEEIIRIYGYEAIPYTLPQDIAAPTRSRRARLLRRLRQILTGNGMMEVSTLSLIGEGLLRRTGFSQDPATTVRVINSHSQDHTLLRQSLLPNLLEVAKHNQDEGNEEIWIFETGRAYFKRRPPTEKDSGVDEPLYCSGLIMGSPRRGIWHQRSETDFYTLKGILENLLDQLSLSAQCRWERNDSLNALHPGQTAAIRLNKNDFGFIGRLHPLLEERLRFKAALYAFEFNLETLYAALEKQPPVVAVESLSAFPSVKRDIAFSAPLDVTHQQVFKAMLQANEPLLRDIQLFDEYRGAQLEKGTRSLAYRLTLQSDSSTLTDAEIESAVSRLKRQLEKQLPVSFR